MIKRLLLVALVFQVSYSYAQTPQAAKTEQTTDPLIESMFACPPGQQSNAGTFSLSTFIGNSNDTDLDTIFLCFGDSIFIDHDATSLDLSGDPNPTTQGGVGFAIYDCPPTITGEELSMIVADPCVLNTPPNPTGIWISTGGNIAGDQWFFNQGQIQTFFFGGNPGIAWFAPITYDSLDNPNPFFEGNPAGPCVNVNTADAFAVAYLNEITATNIMNNANGSDCTGTFDILGGLPELDGGIYDISITLSTDPTVVGMQQGGVAFHGSTVEFQVLEPGIYDIVVSDGKSCPLSFQMDMSNCPTVIQDISDETAVSGSAVCVDITASDFINILSFQYSIQFDTSILQFDSLSNFDPTLTDGGISPIGFGPADPNASAFLTISWFNNQFMGTTLADNTVLFSICFTAIGNVGEVATLDISGDPTPVQIGACCDPIAGGIPVGIANTPGSVTIVPPPSLQYSIDVDSISCAETPALSDGGFTITTWSGTPPYTVSWQNAGGQITGTGQIAMDSGMLTIDTLPAGTYFVSIMDNTGGTLLDTIDIFEPVSLGVGPNVTDPLCAGDSTGSFSINVMGGTMPYSFAWTPTGDTVQNLMNIPSGFYSVVVTDNNGCTASASGTLFNPPAIMANIATTDAACSGVNNGSATITPSGGTVMIDYSYSWGTNPVQNTATASGLGIGTYPVTVTDDNNCEYVDSAVIGGATILLANAVVQDVSCFGGNDGSITTSPSAIGIDNGGYTFIWSNGVAGPLDSAAQNLAADTFSVLIVDALGCFIDSSYVVNQPDSLTISTVAQQDESCTVGSDGQITISVSGGTVAPGNDYVYLWSNGGSTASITGLNAGNYFVTVTDDNGCQDSTGYTINVPLGPSIDSFQVVDVLCASSTDGQITVSVTPGNAAISTIAWSNGQSGSTITGLAPGDYFVTVTATDGCLAVDTTTVNAPAPFALVDTFVTNPTCAGLTDGSIGVQISGGTTPYTYAWSNGTTQNPAINLSAGTYSVSVSDANFCPDFVISITLEDPAPVDISFTNIQNASCFDAIPCDGGATALASGGGAGTGLYNFNWASGTLDPGVMSSTVADLCPGFQVLTVSDALGCFATDSVFIDSPDSISVNELTTIIEDVSCFGDSDGQATVNAQGGTPGYSYFWPHDGTQGQIVLNLSPNTYQVVITDANGCIQVAEVEIGQPEPLVAVVDSFQDITCHRGEDGFIAIGSTGGNIGPLSYDWAGGVSNVALASNLIAGSYSVTITDVEGCTADLVFSLEEPGPIFVQFDTIDPPACFGFETLFAIDSVSGGNGFPFDYTVDGIGRDPVSSTENISGGQHLITIYDAFNCPFDTTIFVPEPAEIIVDLGPDIEIQLGEDLILQALPISALPLDTAQWISVDSTIACQNVFDSLCLEVMVQPIATTSYTVIVTDTAGCVGEDDIVITVDKNRNVFIPNIFSPDGDGVNDQFNINVGVGVEEINYFTIYDRWGELIYARRGFLPGVNDQGGWDGSFRGKRMDPAVFVYLAEVVFTDGRVLLYRGTVTLLR